MTGVQTCALPISILEDRSNLYAELLLASLAVPYASACYKLANIFRIAVRAAYAARPAHRGQELMAFVRVTKIANRARQSFGNVVEILCFHIPNLHLVNNASSI